MSEIKEQVQKFVHKYLEVSPEAESVIVDYALQTWQPLPNAVKYLQFLGDMGTGKTRAGEVMAAICYNSLNVSAFTSLAALMKTMDESGICVPIIDETDYSKEIKTILRVGAMKNNRIVKMVRNEEKEVIPISFNVYGYKVILCRRKFSDNAFQARCITVELSGVRRNEIPRVLDGNFEKDRAEIQQALRAVYVGESVFAL